MRWAGIVNQTIIGLPKVGEGVKLNITNDLDIMDKTFFVWHPVLQFPSEVCIYARQCPFSCI